MPNLARVMVRNIYKYPLLVCLPDFFKRNSPGPLRHNEQTLKLATGFTIAAIETTIMCPIDRVKTYLMTQSYNKTETIKQNPSGSALSSPSSPAPKKVIQYKPTNARF